VRLTDQSLSRPGAIARDRQSGATAAATNGHSAGANCSRHDAVQVPLNEGLQPRASVRRPVGCSGKLGRGYADHYLNESDQTEHICAELEE
jgi:hypothetical protein